MADGGLRLFVAVGLPESARGELRRVGEEMRAFAPDGTRWMDVAGAHLTLQFIGNRPAVDVAMIDAALTQASSRHAPFELSLTGAGVFPSRGAPRVLWVGVGGDLDALRLLQRDVSAVLVAMGCGRQEPTFSPHLTVCRIRPGASSDARAGSDALRRAVTDVDVTPVPLAVEDVGLYRSELLPTGARYTKLVTAPLAGRASTGTERA